MKRSVLGILTMVIVACSGDSTGTGPAPTVYGTYTLVSANGSELPVAMSSAVLLGFLMEDRLLSGWLEAGENNVFRYGDTWQHIRVDLDTGEMTSDEPFEFVRTGVYTITGRNMTIVTEHDELADTKVTGVWDGAKSVTVTQVFDYPERTAVRVYRRN